MNNAAGALPGRHSLPSLVKAAKPPGQNNCNHGKLCCSICEPIQLYRWCEFQPRKGYSRLIWEGRAGYRWYVCFKILEIHSVSPKKDKIFAKEISNEFQETLASAKKPSFNFQNTSQARSFWAHDRNQKRQRLSSPLNPPYPLMSK